MTVIGTAIVLPLVIFVLGPNMPPGKDTPVAKSQVTDNTVLMVVMSPFAVFIAPAWARLAQRMRCTP